jgi:hypothetical protein
MIDSEVSPGSFPAYPATTPSTGAEGTGRSVDFARRQLLTLLARSSCIPVVPMLPNAA